MFCICFLVGSEGYILEEVKVINFLFIVLGKCINVFVENGFYVLVRDFKFIRLLKDLFGGEMFYFMNLVEVEDFDFIK